MLVNQEVEPAILMRSLVTIVRTVSIFYGQTPLLIIDEYDQPLLSAHFYGFREKFSVFYTSFLGTVLKSNKHLYRSILTGIQRVAKESIFSKLNNLAVYTVLDGRFSSFFGLTEDETNQALKDNSYDLNGEIRQYYNGYVFGNNEVYNPWSIISFLDSGIIKSYWVNTSTNLLVKESILEADIGFKRSFDKLILDGEVEQVVNLEASFVELRETGTLWGLLVSAGYLTVVEVNHTTRLMTLKIPNAEAKSGFRTIVSQYANLGDSALDKLNKKYFTLIKKPLYSPDMSVTFSGDKL